MKLIARRFGWLEKATGHSVHKLLQVDHLLQQGLLKNEQIAKLFGKLKISIHELPNLHVLPTPLFKKLLSEYKHLFNKQQLAFIKRAAHTRDVQELFEMVSTRVLNIANRLEKNAICEKIARAELEAFQQELRLGLRSGKLAKSRAEWDALKNFIKSPYGAPLGVFLLASLTSSSANAAEMPPADAEKAAEILESLGGTSLLKETSNALENLTVTHYLGKESWIGWIVDLLNPVEDVRLVLDIADWLSQPVPSGGGGGPEIRWPKTGVPEPGTFELRRGIKYYH